jgi:hypothetical protein
MGFQDRIFVILLDEEAVGSGIDVPVEVLNLIAPRVVPVVREIERKALERRLVQPADEAFDDGLGDQFRAAETGKVVGGDEGGWGMVDGGWGMKGG